MFSPTAYALDLSRRQHLGQLMRSPMQLGTWAVHEPAGTQNHTPSFAGCHPINSVASGWLVAKKEQPAWVS